MLPPLMPVPAMPVPAMVVIELLAIIAAYNFPDRYAAKWRPSY
jgi:hypothetical protein